jgi:protein phosphatase
MLEVTIGQATDPGRLRANNEDAMAAFIPNSPQEARSHGWMLVVADGVGGLDVGDIASAQAVSTIAKGFSTAPAATLLPSLLQQLIQEANAVVHDEGLERQRRGKPMATTVVSCALRYDTAVVAHVGDSRCYHLHNDKLVAVTSDHTFVNEQVRLGLITPAEAAHSENRSVLTRALGPERYVRADTTTVTLKPNDVLLLCTDGIYGAMYDEDILRIISQPKDPQEAAEALVRYAVEVDGSDNATAQVIRICDIESADDYRRRTFRIHGV